MVKLLYLGFLTFFKSRSESFQFFGSFMLAICLQSQTYYQDKTMYADHLKSALGPVRTEHIWLIQPWISGEIDYLPTCISLSAAGKTRGRPGRENLPGDSCALKPFSQCHDDERKEGRRQRAAHDEKIQTSWSRW